MKNIIIIGGGISGLIAAIRLSRYQFNIRVIEKNTYPRHKVCGEYLSREVEDFLLSEKLLPVEKSLPEINTLKLTSAAGQITTIPLRMGGIGLSRYYWENYLYQEALKANVEFIFDSVTYIKFDNGYKLTTRSGKNYTSPIIVGAYGKRSKIDHQLKRPFVYKRSPFVGVKYHVRNENYDKNLISLHNFDGGYCGVSMVEDGILNCCYLCDRNLIREKGNIKNLEETVLKQNPHLSSFLDQATQLFEKPLVINEISFETKSPVEDNIPMIGDSAGMITPLCGNGMAIAVQSAKLLTDILIKNKNISADLLCRKYTNEWNKAFKTRLSWGRLIQNNLFGKNWASSMAVALGNKIPSMAQFLVSKTHGKKI